MKKTARMREVEEEFGGDIVDIIQDFREVGGGNPWRIVAGCLGVSTMTLYTWRKSLGMPLLRAEQVHLPEEPRPWSLDSRARALGYGSAEEAIREMRLGDGLLARTVAERLACSPGSLCKHTPPEVSVLAAHMMTSRDEAGQFCDYGGGVDGG